MQGPRRGCYSKQVLGTQDTRHNDLNYIIKGPPWPRLSWVEIWLLGGALLWPTQKSSLW